MTSKSMEIEDLMNRQRKQGGVIWATNLDFSYFRDKEIQIYSIQWYQQSAHNGIGIIVSQRWLTSIVEETKINDRFTVLKINNTFHKKARHLIIYSSLLCHEQSVTSVNQ